MANRKEDARRNARRTIEFLKNYGSATSGKLPAPPTFDRQQNLQRINDLFKRMNMKTKKYIQPGEKVLVSLPHSEVCIHMRVAGQAMFVELLVSPEGHAMVQLWRGDWDEDGAPIPKDRFSFPITTGEAGVYQDEQGYYVYEAGVYPDETDNG